jgi:hypothetical protein
MALRANAVNNTAYDDLEGSYAESSPDPLAASINENRARARRTATRPKQPLTSTSPSKQNRRSSYALEASSPSKSMVLSTPRAGGASPWRIKVTVEAEPGSDEENTMSPTVKHVTRTKTTTVPLKDPDAASPVKRRGRPRKSDVAATSAKVKRSGTPVKRRAKSKTRASSIGAEGSAADVDTDAPPKKRRGRPRKSIQPQVEDTDTLVVEEPVLPDATIVDDMPFDKPELDQPLDAGDRMTTSQPPNTATPARISSLVFLREQNHNVAQANVAEYEEPIRFTPVQTELSQRLRERKGTPARKAKSLIEISSDEEESDDESGLHTPSGTDEEVPNAPDRPTIETEEARADEDAADDRYDDEEVAEDLTEFAFEEGATRMPDDTTILESENFSMVSVDSLPSSGELTSPAYGPTGRTPAGPNLATIRDSAYLTIPSAEIQQLRNSPAARTSSSGVSEGAGPDARLAPSDAVAPPRYKTPSMESRESSQPPPIEPTRLSPTEAATPKIGRVVTAGVALQGALDPNRLTPGAGPSRVIDEDIFRGFSERTRRELQAGLRLGEQLAQQGPPSVRNSPAVSSPLKARMNGNANDDVFAPRNQSPSTRLLTPEDQDDHQTSLPQTTQPEVQYPTLNVSDREPQLPSPAHSEDEMSWRVDTPPVRAVTAEVRTFAVASNEAGQVRRGHKSAALLEQNERSIATHGDIWEEEASRSFNSPDCIPVPTENSPQLQDLFVQEGAVKPARGKLPRTWRRKSSGNFQYSDEIEEVPEQTPSSTESDEPSPEQVNKGKNKMVEAVQEKEYDEEGDNSEGSDDTGMFFMNNLPSVFNKRQSAELKKKKSEKLDLSLLMQEGESLLPESSPPVVKSQAPATGKLNPFLDTPPRFAIFQSSPVKSSPLRQEIRADTSSPSVSVHQAFEESTLPLPPSSPFHTQVDGESVMTAASDQRQFREEMAAGATDSSLRNIRNEADDYLDAYDAQERSLGEIEEVTEPSRTWVKEKSLISHGSPVKQAFEDSMLRPARTYPSLFGAESASASLTTSKSESTRARDVASTVSNSSMASQSEMKSERKITVVTQRSVKQTEAPAHATQPTQPSSSVFGRLSSTLWTALGSPPTPPNHPILAKYDRLPKLEPWTKTHYKTLDSLYQRHKKTPTLFLPSPSARTSNTNNAILGHFLRTQDRPFVGARYASWGYEVTMDESLVVLAAVYMQLLVLKDMWEYEEKSGKKIQMGDCGPGDAGIEIGAEEVMKRFATVVMGEALRKDEKRGVVIDRSGGLTIDWPA